MCWTGDVGRSFHSKLTEACNNLGPLTEYASEVEVTYYPDSGEDEFHQFFIGPSPEAIHEFRRQCVMEDLHHMLSRHLGQTRSRHRSPSSSPGCLMRISRRNPRAANPLQPAAVQPSFRCIPGIATCTEPETGCTRSQFFVFDSPSRSAGMRSAKNIAAKRIMTIVAMPA